MILANIRWRLHRRFCAQCSISTELWHVTSSSGGRMHIMLGTSLEKADGIHTLGVVFPFIAFRFGYDSRS